MYGIQLLWLGNNEIGDAGLTALADAIKPTADNTSGALYNLESLNFYSNQIGDAGLSAFVTAITPGPSGKGALASLKQLDLAVNRIGDPGFNALAEAIKPREKEALPSAAFINLDHNRNATEAGKKAMLEASALVQAKSRPRFCVDVR